MATDQSAVTLVKAVKCADKGGLRAGSGKLTKLQMQLSSASRHLLCNTKCALDAVLRVARNCCASRVLLAYSLVASALLAQRMPQQRQRNSNADAAFANAQQNKAEQSKAKSELRLLPPCVALRLRVCACSAQMHSQSDAHIFLKRALLTSLHFSFNFTLFHFALTLVSQDLRAEQITRTTQTNISKSFAHIFCVTQKLKKVFSEENKEKSRKQTIPRQRNK